MSRLIELFSSQTRRSGDCGQRLRFVEGAVAEHRAQHVGSSSGEAEQGLGVVLALDDLLVVVGRRGRVAQGGERGEADSPFELLVSSPEGCSPRIDDPGLRVAGARPA